MPVKPSLALDEEHALTARLAAGDEAAFEVLVRTFGGRMLAVATQLLKNESDAKDAVQDAFLSAFRSIERFEGKSRLSTWLHRVTVNAALMKLRTKRRRPELEIDALQPDFEDDGHHRIEPKAWDLNPVDSAAKNEVRTKVRDHIEELPETYRSVILLRDIAQLDTRETAEILEISENAVKIRLHRARLALRTLLDPSLRGTAA